MSIGNTLRDIAEESRLSKAEKTSLRLIAQDVDILQTRINNSEKGRVMKEEMIPPKYAHALDCHPKSWENDCKCGLLERIRQQVQSQPGEFTANLRKEYGISPDARVDKRNPEHGACCTCQICGYDYDDCCCTENRIITICDRIDRLTAENKAKDKAISLLNSMVESGESHTEKSRAVLNQARGGGK